MPGTGRAWQLRGTRVGAARSARQHDEVRALAGLRTKSLVGDDERGTRRHQLGNPLERLGGNADALERFGRVRCGPYRCWRRLDVLALGQLLGRGRSGAGHRYHVPAQRRVVVIDGQGGEDVGAEWPVGFAEGDRHVEHGLEALAYEQLAFLAADEDGDRPGLERPRLRELEVGPRVCDVARRL